MMPPLPSASPSQWFLPYVYVPSENASYYKLVTPLGSLHVSTTFLQDEAWNVIIAMVVVSVSIGLWRVLTAKKTATPTAAATGNSTEDDADAEKSTAASALEENIQTKGANSYYYAHQRRVTSDSGDDDDLKKTMVSSYSWSDSKTFVSIYLTDAAVVDMKDEQLKLDWTPTSLSMDLLVEVDGKDAKSLVIPTLYGEITDVTCKVKKNQLVLVLHKKAETPWLSLNGAAKNLEDHIEYDESLYE